MADMDLITMAGTIGTETTGGIIITTPIVITLTIQAEEVLPIQILQTQAEITTQLQELFLRTEAEPIEVLTTLILEEVQIQTEQTVILIEVIQTRTTLIILLAEVEPIQIVLEEKIRLQLEHTLLHLIVPEIKATLRADLALQVPVAADHLEEVQDEVGVKTR